MLVDFCLIGVMIRMFNEILFVICFRCVEVFFCEFDCDEIIIVVKKVVNKVRMDILEEGLFLFFIYVCNGCEMVNMM